MFNWTKRTNGKRMLTLRIEHNLPVQDMAYVLGCYAVDESHGNRHTGLLEITGPVSRTDGERIFRSHIAEIGSDEPWHAWERRELNDITYWGESGKAEIKAWVVAHLRKHYGDDVAAECDWAQPGA